MEKISFKNIYKLYNTLDIYDIRNDIYINFEDNIPHCDIIKCLNNSRFIWDELFKYIKICNKVLYIKYENLSFRIYYKNKISVPMSRIILMIKHIVIVCKLLKINEYFNFHIFLYNKGRKIYSNATINPININGGFTYINDNKIFILRQEEFIKTMIHEILHHSNIIHNDNYSQDDIKNLKKHFNISNKTDLIPNEAVVEFWTTIINCMLISCDSGIKWENLLEIEIKHSIMQSNKILKLQNKNEWYETTNSYCYIIFKTILLINYKHFLTKYTFPYNPSYITQFLIKNDNIPIVKLNKNKSLRMMILSH